MKISKPRQLEASAGTGELTAVSQHTMSWVWIRRHSYYRKQRWTDGSRKKEMPVDSENLQPRLHCWKWLVEKSRLFNEHCLRVLMAVTGRVGKKLMGRCARLAT